MFKRIKFYDVDNDADDEYNDDYNGFNGTIAISLITFKIMKL